MTKAYRPNERLYMRAKVQSRAMGFSYFRINVFCTNPSQIIYYSSESDHEEVDLRQTIRLECFGHKFWPKFLPPIDFHMVRLTVVDDMSALCFANTETTEPLVKKNRTEYDGVHTFDRD